MSPLDRIASLSTLKVKLLQLFFKALAAVRSCAINNNPNIFHCAPATLSLSSLPATWSGQTLQSRTQTYQQHLWAVSPCRLRTNTQAHTHTNTPDLSFRLLPQDSASWSDLEFELWNGSVVSNQTVDSCHRKQDEYRIFEKDLRCFCSQFKVKFKEAFSFQTVKLLKAHNYE